MVVFLLGHLCYVAAFIYLAFIDSDLDHDLPWGTGVLQTVSAVAVQMLVAVVIWRWISPVVPDRLRRAVFLYNAVINVMVASVYPLTFHPSDHISAALRQTLLAGTWLFLVSDLCVLWTTVATRPVRSKAVRLGR